MSGLCASNPDITGIGVRTAIYAQNIFSFFPAARVLWDGKVTRNELATIEQQSSTILITAFALLFSAIIQARTLGLSNVNATIILNLSWMNNTNVFIYFLLYASRQLERKREGLDGLRAFLGEVRDGLKEPVFWIGSFHLTLMSTVGLWLWSQPATFGGSLECPQRVAIVIFGQRVPLLSSGLRTWSLIVYSLLATPVLNMIVPLALILGPIIFFYQKKNVALPSSDAIAVLPVQKIFQYLAKPVAPLLPGFFTLACVIIVLLADTELSLKENDTVLESTDGNWTFGQTLAMLLLLVPARDFVEVLIERRELRQRMIQTLVENLVKFGSKEDAESLLSQDPDDDVKGKI